MILGIDKLTLSLVTLALDAASMRHNTIANNIANAGSEGYQPQRVNFEEQLGAAGAGSATRVSEATLAGVRPFVEPAPVADKSGTAVMIDMEMVKLAQNTLLYRSILTGLGKKMGILSYVLTEGRR
jgi:flagellar basal-body rod protein FlgB